MADYGIKHIEIDVKMECGCIIHLGAEGVDGRFMQMCGEMAKQCPTNHGKCPVSFRQMSEVLQRITKVERLLPEM